ncbi:MAG: PBP1A family penicillin-binding protein [Vampirovibrio sp.]|nr:PBP1A family penicillin-binding protein [Vampirovibrio sp.]
MTRDFDLPVDMPLPSEHARSRAVLFIVLTITAVLVFLVFMLSLFVGFTVSKGISSLPDVSLLESWHPSQSTRIFDRNNKLIANIHGDEDRVVVPLAEISPNIQRAVMATEDNRFYEHNGVDLRGTIRALVQNLKGGDVQGGSTITQQLVKNLFLSPKRLITRKVAEALLAFRVEKRYEKKKILEMYLNQVYWGNQAYGIEKAARRYFKKPASDLTIPEAALLAGLLKAPEGLSPFVYPDAARKRQLEVLYKMHHNGYISQKQYEESKAIKIQLNRQPPSHSKYPFFVTYVIQELINNPDIGEDVVRRGGLRVYTTLDPELQEAAEKALQGKIEALPEYTKVTQGGLISIDVDNAEIISMVGGADFDTSQFNNVTQARRAAGSSFKPIVYLTGFRLGLIEPESNISDRPVSFNTGYSVWRPKNWDGRFMGPMSVRKALTLSRNTPTVQVGMKVGIDEVIKTARLAGITSNIDRNFSSLLGSSGLAPLEIATAYSTFARGGIRMTPTAVRRIEDIEGMEVSIKRPAPKQVFDPDSIAQLVSIMVDVVDKGTGRSARLPGRQVAGKTGTTDKVRDIWFTGFTPDFVTCVWMGNPNYVPLKGVFSSDSAKVWHAFGENHVTLTIYGNGLRQLQYSLTDTASGNAQWYVEDSSGGAGDSFVVTDLTFTQTTP